MIKQIYLNISNVFRIVDRMKVMQLSKVGILNLYILADKVGDADIIIKVCAIHFEQTLPSDFVSFVLLHCSIQITFPLAALVPTYFGCHSLS